MGPFFLEASFIRMVNDAEQRRCDQDGSISEGGAKIAPEGGAEIAPEGGAERELLSPLQQLFFSHIIQRLTR